MGKLIKVGSKVSWYRKCFGDTQFGKVQNIYKSEAVSIKTNEGRTLITFLRHLTLEED